jgi:cytochrome b6-f complex iron-sulfur subunit
MTQKILDLTQVTAEFKPLEFEFDRTICVLQKIAPPKEANPRVLLHQNLAFVALSRLCTHAGCQNDLPEADGIQFCQCHGSQFDVFGTPVTGPAKLLLAAVRLEVRLGAVYALGWLN